MPPFEQYSVEQLRLVGLLAVNGMVLVDGMVADGVVVNEIVVG